MEFFFSYYYCYRVPVGVVIVVVVYMQSMTFSGSDFMSFFPVLMLENLHFRFFHITHVDLRLVGIMCACVRVSREIEDCGRYLGG